MKKILTLLVLTLSGTAFANGYHGHNRHFHGHGHNHMWWVAPTVVGIIGYEIGRQQPPQPVVIQQNLPPATVCGPWTEIMNSDGTITRTRTCSQ